MGNSIGGRRKARVMKLNGETFKLKTPIRARDVVKDYPSHVLLDSEAVKHFGIRAKPLEAEQELMPRKVYFLVELPKFSEDNYGVFPRRVRSAGIHMSAKDRLECLMLLRRTSSDLSLTRPSGLTSGQERSKPPMTVKMRLRRAEMAKLVEESRDGKELAERIMNLYSIGPRKGTDQTVLQQMHQAAPAWKVPEKRVRFNPVQEGDNPVV